ncbi:hypothetical protein LTR08_004932 [Meristemomyces frigidus]|nr:hypothetical protein LTR08_004932 [Meristemomyces frigidus]
MAMIAKMAVSLRTNAADDATNAKTFFSSPNGAEKARTIERIQADLGKLNDDDLDEIKRHIVKSDTEDALVAQSLTALELADLDETEPYTAMPESRATKTHLISRSLTALDLAEILTAKSHIQQLQNQHSPLLKLPIELRDRIFDLVVLDNFRNIPAPADSSPTRFRLADVCRHRYACRQLRSDCKFLFRRLTRLGIVVFSGWTNASEFDPQQRLWLWGKQAVSAYIKRSSPPKYRDTCDVVCYATRAEGGSLAGRYTIYGP